MENPFAVNVLLKGNQYSPRQEYHTLSNGDKVVKITYPSKLICAISDIQLREKNNSLGSIEIGDVELFDALYAMYCSSGKYVDGSFVAYYCEKLNEKVTELFELGAISEDKKSLFSELGECTSIDELASLFFVELFSLSSDSSNMKSVYAFTSDTNQVIRKLNEWFTPEYVDLFKVSIVMSNPFSNNLNSFMVLVSFLQTQKYEKERQFIKTYVMSNGSGLYKIGKSIDPLKREKMLSTGNPNIRLVLSMEMDIERELHIKFADKKVSGEWFELSEDDLNYIRNYKS